MKTLLALQPFHQDKDALKGLHRIVEQLASKPSDVEVGCVITRAEDELNTAFDVPLEERYTTHPKRLILENLRKIKSPISEKAVHVVDYESLSTSQTVDRLLTLAKSRKAELIALFTHGREGFSRFMMGSFAETTIHRSRLDLLIVGPKTKVSGRVKRVFVSTDFDTKSKKQLERVVALCKDLGAELTVFHVAKVIYKWSLDEASPEVQAYRRRIRAMEEWVALSCSKAKVPCRIIVESQLRSITDLALKHAEKAKADLVVVSAKVGPLAAFLGGSVTRQIVRDGTFPVLVLKH